MVGECPLIKLAKSMNKDANPAAHQACCQAVSDVCDFYGLSTDLEIDSIEAALTAFEDQHYGQEGDGSQATPDDLADGDGPDFQ
jgi:hypothetical protein